MNGFVRVNDTTEQIDNGVESPTEEQTIGFYTQHDIPFYYNTASNFAINDRYFASVLGPTFPNRSYLAAATSFGHLTTSDTFPPTGGGTSPSLERFSTCSTRTRSAGRSRSAPGDFTVFEATLHFTHNRRPHLAARVHRNAIPPAGQHRSGRR